MNTRKLCLVGAVASMLAVAPLTARADYSSTTATPNGSVTTVTSPNATTTVITAPTATPAYTSPYYSTSAYNTPTEQQAFVNYQLLTNKSFDFLDLAGARASGLSDKQIAVAAKVADTAGVPFKDVTAAILRGETYYQIADDYNLRPSDVTDTSNEEVKINQYQTAYANTGDMAITRIAGNQMILSNVSGTSMMADQNIVQTLRASGNYTMLNNALKSAGLLDTLRGPGPFTLFAPTDAAFAKLSSTDLDYLMANTDKLRTVLNYHVIPARIDAATAMAMTSPTSPATVEGDTLQVTTLNGRVMVNNATVVQPDILCTNGVIHGIDSVIIPPSVTLP